ncbi:AAA-like domain-containing protein [Microcystis aeruginosa BLCCF158]|uniref:AAA-like domain-containing protein n=1 Tax=Microcystis aeruginosa BLCC-F158 TaxID=2755316 RepID=A0A841V5X4_MICAE|nr:AAA-like domain-containing protein [Microcystis aeruginosa]MBC1196384.1 AAA-like domain-containing protein [Microcystis aeruginosa BLCC-F158]
MTNLYYHSGSLPIESPTYIKRDADSQLFDALKNREFCCLLESRQTGKTSLSFRTGKRLKEVGIFYLYHYMGKNSPKNSEQWYKEQIIAIIVDSLINYKIDLLNENTTLKDVPTKLEKWWEARPGSNLRKYEDFLEGHLLENIRGDIVFCIDEIGSVIEFPFSTDEFFEFIRGCHEDRRSKPQYSRLTFCLIGLASIDDLIRNKNENTPSFNIGTSVTLSPFPTDLNNEKSLKTMQPLLNAGIEDISTFQEILNWTGGQPFLTQKICDLIVKKRQSTHPQFTNVEEVVISEIINNWQDDTHFTTIQTKLVGNQKKAFETLDLYKEILEKRQIEYDCRSEGQTALRLSGLVLKNEGKLKLYNRIYEQIFNPSWVKQEKAKLRLYIEEFDSWNEWEKWKETNNLDYDLQERYLLYGTKCDRVQQWRIKFNEDNGKLYEKEGNFLDRSKTFWREVKDLFSDLQINEGTMESIIQSANDLTGGLHKFNRIVFHIAKNNNVVDLQQDEVQGWLENLVLSNSSNLELFKEYDLFRQDRDQFLNRDDSFDLISLFEKIAQKEPILFDEKNPQHRKLKAMCFIILDKEHNLRILNKIYEKILDQNWIKEVMAGLRPYTKAFRDWQHSDRQESSYLLQNNDIKLALEWLGKKPTPTLEEGEIKFVMTSLVAEVWAKASPSVQSEAISLITTSRPSLQGKNNYSDFLLREILQWTTSQTAALKKLLEWVNESDIPVENIRKYLEFLVRSQIKNWSYQELFDFALAPHSSYPEREQRIFITFDQYCLGEIDQSQIQEPLKECGKILDKYQNLNENDFQELVFNFLKTKIARISLMTQQRPEQEKLDVLLDETVTTSKGHLKSILIFNLENGLPLYHNKRLKSDDPELYRALFADGGDAVGEAIEGFESLSKIQEALDNFGKVTAFGNLTYSIFKLAGGTMMVYFVELTTPFAICFIAPDGINLGLVVTRSQAKIKEIKNELEELGF